MVGRNQMVGTERRGNGMGSDEGRCGRDVHGLLWDGPAVRFGDVRGASDRGPFMSANEKCPVCDGDGFDHGTNPVRGACPACSGTGQKPNDSKIESKYQGASPSVTPAVTTDPRIDDRREDENVAARLYEAHMGTRDLIAPPGWDELPQFVRDSWLRQAAEPSMRCTAADARDIATEAHKGQTDRLGNPYIEHVERVAQGFSGGALTVALLHDVIEDSDHTLGSLLDAGVPLDLLPAIDALTRRENETYRSYILRVRDDHIAKLVKRADLRDHLKPDRSGGIGKHQRDKYELALMVLG